jgi:hypothetical protein
MRPAYGIAVLTLVAGLLAAPLSAQVAPATRDSPGKNSQSDGARSRTAACRVEGVWELVSITSGGQEEPLRGYRQRKIVSRGHYMWVGADAKRDTITLRTSTDSLRAFRVAGGTGAYRVDGNTYTEQLEIFVDPTIEGRPFSATCRTEGDRWYHSFMSDSTRPTVEVWRRIR